jgi:hypothetical protein
MIRIMTGLARYQSSLCLFHYSRLKSCCHFLQILLGLHTCENGQHFSLCQESKPYDGIKWTTMAETESPRTPRSNDHYTPKKLKVETSSHFAASPTTCTVQCSQDGRRIQTKNLQSHSQNWLSGRPNCELIFYSIQEAEGINFAARENLSFNQQ